jgi:hypothetical protein
MPARVETRRGLLKKSRLLTLTANIRLGWKLMAAANKVIVNWSNYGAMRLSLTKLTITAFSKVALSIMMFRIIRNKMNTQHNETYHNGSPLLC